MNGSIGAKESFADVRVNLQNANQTKLHVIDKCQNNPSNMTIIYYRNTKSDSANNQYYIWLTSYSANSIIVASSFGQPF